MTEIIVIMVIIAVLAAFIIPAYTAYIDKAGQKACQINRSFLLNHYHYYKKLKPGAGYNDFIAAENFGGDVTCPARGVYKYDIDPATGKERIKCSVHGGHFYNFYFTTKQNNLAISAKSSYAAFIDYYEYAVANGLTDKSIASLTYNMGLKKANGDTNETDKAIKFWNGVMAAAGLSMTDLNKISDSKFFAVYNEEGQRTNEVNAVFYKIGGKSVMYFAATGSRPEAYYISNKNWTDYPSGIDRFDRLRPLNPDGTLMEGFEQYTP